MLVFAELFDEGFVAVALLAAQVEVAVHSLYVVPQPTEHQQQAYAVGTAAECY